MKPFHSCRCLHVFLLIGIVSFLCFFPQAQALEPLDERSMVEESPALVETNPVSDSDSRLTPIKDTQLEALSPALKASPKKEFFPVVDPEFQNSVCFKRCHGATDFRAEDRTARQWRLLIGENGHSLFEEIPWKSTQEKEEILNYLLRHSKDTRPAPAGIGVW